MSIVVKNGTIQGPSFLNLDLTVRCFKCFDDHIRFDYRVSIVEVDGMNDFY